MSETKSLIDTWAIVDLFGHAQIAGRVTEQSIGSEAMLRVDVPEISDRPAFTRFYGVKAVYSLTPVAEEIARAAVLRLRERPITVYGLALPAPNQDDIEFAEDMAGLDEDDDDFPDGTCEVCGGEYGDGWSNCTCED